MRHTESHMQRACVRWFALQYPELDGLLFAVPNGGRRGKLEACILKAEGVVAGVSDLILLYPAPPYHGLLIEMKTETGRQSPAQRSWQAKAERAGYRYAVIRSPEAFAREISAYLRRNSPRQPQAGA